MIARKFAITIIFGGVLLTIAYVIFPQKVHQQYGEFEDDLMINTQRTEVTKTQTIALASGGKNQNTFKDLDKLLCSKESTTSRPVLQRPCPKNGIATIIPGGRTGNQMWEYSAVWFVAKETGLEPYIPTCIKVTLDEIFDEMSLQPLQAIAHCPFDFQTSVDSMEKLLNSNQSLIVPAFSFQRELAVPHIEEIVREFKFRKSLRDKAQKDLFEMVANSSHVKNRTFIGVHVRRTDYGLYLKRKRNATLVSTSFFHKAMNFYRGQFPHCLFIYISDDPHWCFREFGSLSDVIVPSLNTRNSAAEDLALMAACNHTIFDYGTFGEWGAILAGGLTIFNNMDGNINARLDSWILMD